MRTSRRPAPATPPARRVEVVVTEDTAGQRAVQVRDMSYGEGVGWYVQRTISLDATQVDALMRSLCCAKQACCGQREAASELPQHTGASSKILRLTQLTRRG